MNKIHDRRSTDTLAAGQYAPIEVVDPYGRDGEQIVVLRQLRRDPLAGLHSRGQIDDAQYQAGRRYQAFWEAAERGSRAIDYTIEKVDGGRFLEPDTGRRRHAAEQLNEANRKLGKIGSSIAFNVLVQGLSMAQIVDRHGLSGQHHERVFGKQFRDGLDTLAELWKLSNGTR